MNSLLVLPFASQAHHLLYGGGFQTWEYSPTYALRSYGYLLLHIFPILATNTTNKVSHQLAGCVLLGQ